MPYTPPPLSDAAARILAEQQARQAAQAQAANPAGIQGYSAPPLSAAAQRRLAQQQADRSMTSAPQMQQLANAPQADRSMTNMMSSQSANPANIPGYEPPVFNPQAQGRFISPAEPPMQYYSAPSEPSYATRGYQQSEPPQLLSRLPFGTAESAPTDYITISPAEAAAHRAEMQSFGVTPTGPTVPVVPIPSGVTTSPGLGEFLWQALFGRPDLSAYY